MSGLIGPKPQASSKSQKIDRMQPEDIKHLTRRLQVHAHIFSPQTQHISVSRRKKETKHPLCLEISDYTRRIRLDNGKPTLDLSAPPVPVISLSPSTNERLVFDSLVVDPIVFQRIHTDFLSHPDSHETIRDSLDRLADSVVRNADCGASQFVLSSGGPGSGHGAIMFGQESAGKGSPDTPSILSAVLNACPVEFVNDTLQWPRIACFTAEASAKYADLLDYTRGVSEGSSASLTAKDIADLCNLYATDCGAKPAGLQDTKGQSSDSFNTAADSSTTGFSVRDTYVNNVAYTSYTKMVESAASLISPRRNSRAASESAATGSQLIKNTFRASFCNDDADVPSVVFSIDKRSLDMPAPIKHFRLASGLVTPEALVASGFAVLPVTPQTRFLVQRVLHCRRRVTCTWNGIESALDKTGLPKTVHKQFTTDTVPPVLPRLTTIRKRIGLPTHLFALDVCQPTVTVIFLGPQRKYSNIVLLDMPSGDGECCVEGFRQAPAFKTTLQCCSAIRGLLKNIYQGEKTILAAKNFHLTRVILGLCPTLAYGRDQRKLSREFLSANIPDTDVNVLLSFQLSGYDRAQAVQQTRLATSISPRIEMEYFWAHALTATTRRHGEAHHSPLAENHAYQRDAEGDYRIGFTVGLTIPDDDGISFTRSAASAMQASLLHKAGSSASLSHVSTSNTESHFLNVQQTLEVQSSTLGLAKHRRSNRRLVDTTAIYDDSRAADSGYYSIDDLRAFVKAKRTTRGEEGSILMSDLQIKESDIQNEVDEFLRDHTNMRRDVSRDGSSAAHARNAESDSQPDAPHTKPRRRSAVTSAGAAAGTTKALGTMERPISHSFQGDGEQAERTHMATEQTARVVLRSDHREAFSPFETVDRLHEAISSFLHGSGAVVGGGSAASKRSVAHEERLSEKDTATRPFRAQCETSRDGACEGTAASSLFVHSRTEALCAPEEGAAASVDGLCVDSTGSSKDAEPNSDMARTRELLRAMKAHITTAELNREAADEK